MDTRVDKGWPRVADGWTSMSKQKSADWPRRLVPVGRRNVVLGECNPTAKLSDADVEMIRTLREEHGLTYVEIAAKFDEPGGVRVSVSYVTKLCTYQRRANTPEAFVQRPATVTPAKGRKKRRARR